MTGAMNIDHILQHFGSPSEAARQLGVRRQAIYEWRENGIPYTRQIGIQNRTNGALTADLAHAPEHERKRVAA